MRNQNGFYELDFKWGWEGYTAKFDWANGKIDFFDDVIDVRFPGKSVGDVDFKIYKQVMGERKEKSMELMYDVTTFYHYLCFPEIQSNPI